MSSGHPRCPRRMCSSAGPSARIPGSGRACRPPGALLMAEMRGCLCDEVPPRRREIQIGARHRHGERVCREFGGIALEEIIDIRSAAQKDAAQDQSLHGCGVCDGIRQREGAAPAAAEHVHLAVDVQLMAQGRNIVDQVLGRIVGQRRSCVIIFARTGRALAATAVVEQDDAVPLRVDEVWLPTPGRPCMTITGSPPSVPDSSQ
jgi:hypothetical protein